MQMCIDLYLLFILQFVFSNEFAILPKVHFWWKLLAGRISSDILFHGRGTMDLLHHAW